MSYQNLMKEEEEEETNEEQQLVSTVVFKFQFQWKSVDL